MGQIIENRPIGCTYCGYGPVNGREDFNCGVREIRWICPRCGRLIRVDEERNEK